MSQETSHQHNLVCFQVKGAAGEIRGTTPLTLVAQNLIMSDVTKIEDVCPQGQVQCSDCGLAIATSPHFKAPELDFKAILGNYDHNL